MPLDVERLAELVAIAIQAEIEPLLERIALLEQRQPLQSRDGQPGRDGEKGQDGRDGRDADPAIILELKAEIKALRSELAPVPVTLEQTENDINLETISALVKSAVADAVSQIHMPKDGQDGQSVYVGDVAPMIVAEVQKAVTAIPPAKDGAPGQSVDLADVDVMVSARVSKAVAVLPAPKDGVSLTVEDVAPLIVAEVSKAVAAVPLPKDPVGVVGALIDREGHLILTLSDGVTKDVGSVVGRDVDMVDVTRLITDEVAKFPRPKDGVDGKDGLGFEDLEPVYDEFGRLSLRYMRGDSVKSGRVPGFVDRGVYKPDTVYERGDGVTWGGSFWIAQEATNAKPGESGHESRAWRLAVKKGGEGKPGEKGIDGKPGRDGRDLTKVYDLTGRNT